MGDRSLYAHQVRDVRDEPDGAVLAPLADALPHDVAVAQVDAAVGKAARVAAHSLKTGIKRKMTKASVDLESN